MARPGQRSRPGYSAGWADSCNDSLDRALRSRHAHLASERKKKRTKCDLHITRKSKEGCRVLEGR